MGLTRITFCSLSKNGELISQPRMSTGENLLLSILGSLEVLYNKRTKHNDGRPCIYFWMKLSWLFIRQPLED